MATQQKFYLRDATTSNTGTMPSGAILLNVAGSSTGTTGDATGARTARAMSDVPGAAQTSATFTSNATTSAQTWGMRRWVSPPLAAQTFAAADGNWTLSWAAVESNTNHNGNGSGVLYLWRPSTGARVGTVGILFTAGEPLTSETFVFQLVAMSGTQAILDGDIFVLDFGSGFTQSMGTAYTESVFYEGTTEGSSSDIASYIQAPAALTLFTPSAQSSQAADDRRRRRRIRQGFACIGRLWDEKPSGLIVPNKDILIPA